MIVTKIFKFDSKNIDSTIIDIAKEIERGYTVVSIDIVDNQRIITADPSYRLLYEVTLTNRSNGSVRDYE